MHSDPASFDEALLRSGVAPASVEEAQRSGASSPQELGLFLLERGLVTPERLRLAEELWLGSLAAAPAQPQLGPYSVVRPW
ncbi:MAG: hypothetical protein KDD82_29560 [Planctomycetes bacterium]|nr:hypothetical protein [Planctomycetota bacterium]